MLELAGPELYPGLGLRIRAKTSAYTRTCIGTNIISQSSKEITFVNCGRLLRYTHVC